MLFWVLHHNPQKAETVIRDLRKAQTLRWQLRKTEKVTQTVEIPSCFHEGLKKNVE